MTEKSSVDESAVRNRSAKSDEEIIDRLEARDRTIWRMVLILTGGIALAFAAMAVAIFSGHAALATGMSGQIVFAAFVGALFIYVFATIGKYTSRTAGKHPIQAQTRGGPRVAHRRMDIRQRSWRRSILFFVVIMFFAVLGLSRALPLLRVAHPVLLWPGISLAGCMFLFSLILSAGPAWEKVMLQSDAREFPVDEFDSALRGRTMRFGYNITMLLLGIVLLVGLERPDLTLTVVAWALYVGFAIPALYYVIADWRASHGDES